MCCTCEAAAIRYAWHAQMEISMPPVHEISVRGAENTFTGNAKGSADLEVTLDMQVWPYVPYWLMSNKSYAKPAL